MRELVKSISMYLMNVMMINIICYRRNAVNDQIYESLKITFVIILEITGCLF